MTSSRRKSDAAAPPAAAATPRRKAASAAGPRPARGAEGLKASKTPQAATGPKARPAGAAASARAKAKPAAPPAPRGRPDGDSASGARAESAAAYLARVDPALGRVIASVGEVAIEVRGETPFSALAQAVVYQQLSGKAAATIWARVSALAGGELTPEAALSLSEDALRSGGLSRAKSRALQDLAMKILDGLVPAAAALAALSDAEIIRRLVQVRGIGQWTAEMFLIFHLRRLDVFPAADYGVRKGYALVYGVDELPAPAALLREADRWRPHRTAAAWYLWRATELEELRRR